MEELERSRLWIGNLDEKVTEYQLLKIVQKYGEIDKFDLLYHRSGQLAGKSRGYSFVSYKHSEDAKKALIKLDGLLLGSKRIHVKYATSKDNEHDSKTKPLLHLPVLSGPKKNSSHNQSSKIEAIEKKLKMMEQNSDLDPVPVVPSYKKIRTDLCMANTSNRSL